MKYLYLSIFLFATTVTFGQTSWIQKGGPLGGEVEDVEYYPGTSNVWALVRNHVYKSSDDGQNWVRSTLTALNDNSIYDIEISNNTIYFLAYDELFVSTDQGATINSISHGSFSGGQKIKRLPVSGNLVILAENGSTHTYFSTNNGATWTAGNSFSNNVDGGTLAVNAVDQVFIIENVAGVYRPFRSTNNGQSFSEYSSGIGSALNIRSISNSPAGDIYGVTLTDVVSLNSTTDIWSSIQGSGMDATVASFSNSPSFLDFTLDGLGMYFIDNVNHKLYLKAVSDPATSWVRKATDFPYEGNGSIYPTQEVTCAASKNFSTTSSTAVFGTRIGMVRTSTSGSNIPESNAGIAQVYTGNTVATSNGTLLTQTYSVGLIRSVNSGDSWTRITQVPLNVSSVYSLLIGAIPQEGTYLMAMDNSSNFYRSGDDGASWNPVTTPVQFFGISPGDSARVFATNGGSTVYYSGDGASSWGTVPITGLPGGAIINNLLVPTSTRTIYAVLNSGAYYKIAVKYNASNVITAATATVMTSPPINSSNLHASNGRLYVYDTSANTITVFDGTSWSAVRAVPDGELFVTPSNGYILVADSGTPTKIYMSKDDGVSFTSTTLPTGVRVDVQDITITPQDFVFLTTYENYTYESKTKVVLPAVPTKLVEIANMGNVYEFKWQDNAYNETAYRILRSSDGGTTYTIIGTVDGGDICGPIIGGIGYYADNTVVPGASYKYKLKVVNEAGEAESAVLTPGGVIPALALPSIPDNRSWSEQNTGGTGFTVQSPKIVSIKHMGNGRYVASDVLDNCITFSSQTSAQDFYLNNGISVIGGAQASSSSYQVKPNGTGTTNGTTQIKLKWVDCADPTRTETITYTLQANDPTPAQPTLQAVIANTSQVELSWASLDYATSYVIERSTTSASADFTQIGSTLTYPATTITDDGLAVGTTYYYRMKASSSNALTHDSPYSDVVTVDFKNPNFIVSATTVSAYVSTTIGAYWADFNNDGNEDLLTVDGTLNGVGIATVTVFKNLGSAGNYDFEVKTQQLDAYAYNFGAVSDINGDGNMDISLAIAETAQVDFYKGNGDFTFTKFTPAQIGDLATVVKGERQGIMWGDINNDGRLDVIMSGDYDALLDDRISVSIQNANGTFTNIDAGDLSHLLDESFSTFWIDSNNDGFTDVIVTGGDGALKIYQNNRDNTFTLLTTAQSGISDDNFLGISTADFNNDGFIDFFAGGAENSASAIYLNDKDGSFTKQDNAVFADVGFVISPAIDDINNDGLQDILVTGFLGTPTELFVNTSTGSTLTFTKIATEKINDVSFQHLGAAFGDYNKDGFVDLALGSLHQIGTGDDDFGAGNSYLFQNTNSTGNWSEIRLKGTTANKNGLGAHITVIAGGKSYTKEVASSSSFLSLNSLATHFGLGTAASITSITVRWPTNPVALQVVSNPAINTIITITQDTNPPVVTARNPADGTTGVALVPAVDVTFDEAATAVSGKKLNITGTGDSSPTISLDVTAATMTGNKFSFTIPAGMVENKHYDVTIDAGAFLDQYQNPTLAIGSWGFTTTNVDAVAPVFGDQTGLLPTSLDKAALSPSTKITIPITDNRAVTAASIFVKSISGSSYTEVPGTAASTAPGWDFVIPSNAFDNTGLQFYFTAKDAATNSTRSPVGVAVNKIQVKYAAAETQIPAARIGSGGTATGWKVVAVPFNLGSNNGVQVVFDELTNATPALTAKVDYRIVTYTETPAPAWQDYPQSFSTIDRGAGYFINVKAPVNIFIGDALTAPPNARDDLFSMNLKAGWNMIGNPYLEEIDWTNVVTLNSLTGTPAATLKKFSSGSYSNDPSLLAYEGGFVNASAAMTIKIPFKGQISSGRISDITFNENEWLVPMTLQQGEITNTFGGVGMHSKASMSFDMLDDINGPRWFEFTEMSFSHPEETVKFFARDVVPVANEFTWEFTVDSNLPGVATMNWDNESYVIAHDLYLYDVNTQRPVNMKENKSYSFDPKVSGTFKIYYGENVLSKIKPAKLALSVPYPNPTSGVSTVQFSIPEKNGVGNAISVSLEVFDMTGRKVHTISKGSFAPGFYNAQWEANESLGSGIYFYRLLGGDEVVTSKLVLKR